MGEPSVTDRDLRIAAAARVLDRLPDARAASAEAEDVVQEGLLRLHRADAVEHPKAFVATVVTRLSIDELRSARARRETYVGPWLPEPLRHRLAARRRVGLDGAAGHARGAHARSSARSSCCTTSSTTATTRSPRSSARRARTAASSRSARAATSRRAAPRFEPSREQREALAARFFEAIREGDLDGLVTPARRGRRRDRRRRRQGGGAHDPAARRREDRALHARPDAARRARRLHVRVRRGQRRGRAR